ncbi:MAG: Multidrug resistance efflux pump [Candidatus Eremiobacteraeota bacterium]|nr:Multidrug resistance efflux pump [Candidatus Eremiobacteraeota bacterium]
MRTVADETAERDVRDTSALDRTLPPMTSTVKVPARRWPWMRIAGAAAVAAVALYFASHWFFYDRHRVYTDDAMIDTNQVFVTSKVAERVARVVVEENQFVRRGQTLVVLDDANERAALDLAQQNLRSLRASANAAGDAASLEREMQSAQVQEQAGGVDAARKSAAFSQMQATAAMRAVAVAQAQVASARSQLSSALAAVPAAKQALSKAQADRERFDALAREGYVAPAAQEAAVAAVAQARATLGAAVAQTESARASVRMAQAALEQQRANATAATGGTSASAAQIPIARAKTDAAAAPSRVATKRNAAVAAGSQADAMAAQVRIAQLALRDTRIVAPVDGWVSARNAEEGQTLAPGQAVVTISPANRIYVTANYKETQINRIRPGMPVEISVDACGGAKVRGTVTGFAPVAQNALSTMPQLSAPTNFVKVTQRVPIRIALPKAAGACIFRPGTAVETAVIAD